MRRVRIIEVTTAVLIAGSLTACAGKSAATAAAQQPAASDPATTAVATATTTATTPPAPATTAKSTAKATTIGALLAGFSPGPITVKHMPKADPAWVARVQTESSSPDGYPKVTDAALLNLMALVDEAAREKDTSSLTRLCSDDCDAKTQLPLWQKPGALATLSTIIERTHRTEGDLFPGFILAGGGPDADDRADIALLGATSAEDYIDHHGALATSFSSGTGGPDLPPEHWTGLHVWSPYPAS